MSTLSSGVINSLVWGAQTLGQITPLRETVVQYYDRKIKNDYQRLILQSPQTETRLQRRREMALTILYTVNRIVAEERLGPKTLQGVFRVIGREILFLGKESSGRQEFQNQYQAIPPSSLVVSPTKTCNLHCTGCYADSGNTSEKLDWPTFTRIISEAEELWGIHFFGISGGEPFLYHDQGKTFLNLAEEHPDSFFLVYTNGTLLNQETISRLAQLGNVTPAISVEGLQESTDNRRGEGAFDQIVTAMNGLREAKIPFGISMTATNENFKELLSDGNLNFFFEKMGALYGWLFQYMPIGRTFTLDSMPTAKNRLTMMNRLWEVVRQKHYFLVDFWNSGILVNGCIAAGGHSGYFYIDWNGAVSPCVFVPYSPVNIKDIYSQGKNLNDIWSEPFFAAIRQWQEENKDGNLLRPCLIRDHHEEFMKILSRWQPEPIDENAQKALKDKKYHQGLEKFDEELAELTDPLWENGVP